MVPVTLHDRGHRPPQSALQAVNGTQIDTFGTHSLTVTLGLRRSFLWVFTIADVKIPILGADFLRHFGLLVDVSRNRLTDSVTNLRVQGIVSRIPSLSPTFVSL